MKRLIKKSEIYDGFNIANNYYEVFKNPTTSEIEEVKKQNSYNAIRGIILSDGTIYIWSGSILHDDINKNTNEKIDVNQFRFAYEGSSWIIDAHQKYSEKEIYNYLVEYENILSNFGNINDEFYIYSCTDRRYTKRMLQDIKLTLKENVASRLTKKSEIYDGFNNGNKYYEVFKNPTDSEIEEIKKQNSYRSIRGVILSDGTIYAWSGNILHHNINKNANEKIDVNQFRFAYDPGEWIIDLNKNFTKQQGLEMIKKYNSILSRFGDIQETFFIFFASDFKQYNSMHVLYNEIDEELAQTASNFSNKLTKRAEAYSGFELDGIFHEVFKNPTNSEIQECKKEYNSIRGVINNEGIFVWPGEIWHKQLQRVVQDPVDINGFRFAYTTGDWEFNLHHKYELKDVLKIIDDNYNLFSSVGDLDKYMNIGPDKKAEYYDIMGYNHLKAVIQDRSIMIFNCTNKKTRLKKVAEYIHCHNCGWDNGDFGYPGKDTIYKTKEEYEEKNPNHICPKCKNEVLDID